MKPISGALATAAQDAQPIVARGALARFLAPFLTLFVLAAVLTASGCGRQAVRASEKEFLADRIMVFDEDSQETTADEHILTNREGSAGGRGSGGGGCGCN